MTEELQNEQNEQQVEDETVYKAEAKAALGSGLGERLQTMVATGGRSRLIIHNKRSGQQLADIPLAAGLAVAGGVAFMAPFWAIIGSIAAVVTPVSFEVTKREEAEA